MTTPTEAPLRNDPPHASAVGATCPLCHTVEPGLTLHGLAAGGDWTCRVCGQFWDAERLATSAAYKAWVRDAGPMPSSRWTRARYGESAPRGAAEAPAVPRSSAAPQEDPAT